jgi:hypothetical protein
MPRGISDGGQRPYWGGPKSSGSVRGTRHGPLDSRGPLGRRGFEAGKHSGWVVTPPLLME